MAVHRRINKTWLESIAVVASAALSTARSDETAGNGTVSVSNADGTRTVIGEGAGEDETGGPVGMACFVGDETPPSAPTGVSFSTGDGAITGVWDGTLEDGVPADFARVVFRLGGAAFGSVAVAGSATSVPLVEGEAYECDAVAYDVQGNVSDACEAVEVVCSSDASEALTLAEAASEAAQELKESVEEELAAAQEAASEAQALAEAAQEAANSLSEQVTEISVTVDGYATTIAGAVETAESALEVATTVETTVSGVQATVNEIYEDYVTSTTLEEYSTTEQTADMVASAVSLALYDEDGAEIYATSSSVEQTADKILSQVASLYVTSTTLEEYSTTEQTADMVASAVSSALYDEDGAEIYATSSSVEQTADEILSQVATTYLSTEDAAETYATQSDVSQSATEILSTVAETYLSSADAEETYASQSYVDQTATSIMSKVATLYVSTDTLESNYSTTEQTEELVSSTVSNSLTEYLTSGEIASLYATQTEVEQTAEEVTATVSAKITSRNVYPGFAVGGESPLWSYLTGYTNTGSYGSWEVLEDGWARCDYDYSSGTSGSQVLRAYMYPVAGFEESTDYTCLVEVRNVAHESGEASLVGCSYPSSSNVPYFPSGVDSDATVSLASAEEGEYRFDVTTIDDFDAVDGSYARSVCVLVKAYAGSVGSVECRVSYYKGAGYTGPYAPWTEAVDVSSMMRATTDGLEVARKVNGEYTSTRTLMDDEGFHVMSADGEELSSFEADRVELGKNSSDAVIEMCGGGGSIYCTDNVMRLGAKLSDDETAGGVYFTTYSTSSDGSELYESDAGFGMTDPLTFALTTLYTSVYYSTFSTAALAAAFSLISGMQAGYATATASAGEHTAVTVDFGTTYSQRPYLSATLQHNSSIAFQWHVRSVGTDSFVMDVYNPSSGDCTVTINWVSFTR